MDERRDPGEFYPGGRVIGRDGVAPGQVLVNWSDIQGKPDFSDVAELGEEATRGEMKQTMNTVINKLKTSLLIGALFVVGSAVADVEPLFAKADDIPGNQQIMTNTQEYVDAKVAGIPEPDFSTSNETLVATIEATAPAPGNYAAVSNAAMNAVQPNDSIEGWVHYYSYQGTNGYSIDIGNNNRFYVSTFGLDAESGYIDFSVSLNNGTYLINATRPLHSEDPEIANELYKTGLKVSTLVDGTFSTASYTALGIASPYYDFQEGEYKYSLLSFPKEKSGTIAVTTDIPTDKINQTVDQMSEARREIASIITTNTKQDAELANIGNHLPRLQLQLDAATETNAAQSAALAALPAAVTNIVREASGGIWDAALEVWWTPRMRNGSLTYEATTNVNLNAEN